MPPFMREFVMRRSQQHSSPAPAVGATPGAPPVSTPPLPPNGGTPSGCPPPTGGSPSGWGSCENTPTKIRKPTPQIRPQSAFIPPGMLCFFKYLGVGKFIYSEKTPKIDKNHSLLEFYVLNVKK